MPETSTNPKRAFRIHRWQACFFLAPVVAVALIGRRLHDLKPESFQLLWTEPVGVRMSVLVIGWWVALAAACLAGTAAINRSAARSGWSVVRSGLLAGILLVWVVIGCVPPLVVLLVGPAAAQIERDLRVG